MLSRVRVMEASPGVAAAVLGVALVAVVPPATAATPPVPVGPAVAGVTARPAAAGAPVAIVWHSGSTVFGSALDGSGARELLRVSGETVVQPTPSPDGARVALIARGRLLVLDAATGTVRDAGASVSPTGPGRWSPDGSRVAATFNGRVVVCEAAGGCARWGDHVTDEYGLSWSPDSQAVVLVRQTPRGRGREDHLVVSTVQGRTIRVLERLRTRGSRFPFPSLDGTGTAFRGERPTSVVRTLTAGGRDRDTGIAFPGFDASDEDRLEVVGTLPDGRLALTSRRSTSRRVDLRLGSLDGGAGPVVRRAEEIGVATARTGNLGNE